jgi:hypothetical protein
MLDRSTFLLKVLCLGLAAVFALQCARATRHKQPLAGFNFNITGPLPLTETKAPEKSVSPGPAQRLPPGAAFGPAAGKPIALPSAVQARVDRIVQSEILGPVVRPLPMALLGIGGKDAVIRAPNGQTGLLREGEQLGGIKLLRIGTNRVLIEENGAQKELSVFSGFGSETLLSKERKPSSETNR